MTNYKSMGGGGGGGLLPWKPELWSSLLSNLIQPFPRPNDATHKIRSKLTNWLQWYLSPKMETFRHSRASNSKLSGLIRLDIELERAIMPVMVTSIFDDDSIKNGRANMETPFSHYKYMYMGKFLDAQGQLTPSSFVRYGWNSNSSVILYMSSIPANIKSIGSKATEKKWRYHFPNYKWMGDFCSHWHQRFNPICLKKYTAFSHPQWCYI